MPKNVICLWYDGTAEEAANFYAQTFPDSAVQAVHRAPGDYPDGKEDNTHFTELGARLVAQLVLYEIRGKIPDLAERIVSSKHY